MIDIERSRAGLQRLYDTGVRSLAVVLLHSYTFPDHEVAIGRIAKEIGFTQISLSSQLLPMIKAVSRGHSAAADAYLSPVVQKYIDGFRSGFVGELEDSTRGARCEFMQSCTSHVVHEGVILLSFGPKCWYYFRHSSIL